MEELEYEHDRIPEVVLSVDESIFIRQGNVAEAIEKFRRPAYQTNCAEAVKGER